MVSKHRELVCFDKTITLKTKMCFFFISYKNLVIVCTINLRIFVSETSKFSTHELLRETKRMVEQSFGLNQKIFFVVVGQNIFFLSRTPLTLD